MRLKTSHLLFALAPALGVQARDKWSLRRCVDYAVEHNISVQQTQVQERLNNLVYEQSKSGRWPSANFSLGMGAQNGRSIDPTTNQFITTQVGVINPQLQTSVTLFNWNSIKNQIEANRLTAEASRFQTEKIKNDISLNVANAYLQALLTHEQLNVAELTLRQTNEQLAMTRKRVEAGALPELNAAELEAQQAQDSSNMLVNKNSYEINLLQLKALLNLDAATDFDIETPPVAMIPVEPIADLQPADVYLMATTVQPQQKANELRLQSAKAATRSARGQMYPTIGAFGSLQSSYASSNKRPDGNPVVTVNPTQAYVNVGGSNYYVQAPSAKYNDFKTVAPFSQFGDNFRQSVGLNIQVPIFNGNQAKTNWKRSMVNEQNILLQMKADSQTLKQNIYQAYENALSGLQTWNSRQRAAQLAEKTYALGRKRYELGLLPTLDLITLQSNLQRASIQALAAQFDYVFRMKVLEFYRGQGLKL